MIKAIDKPSEIPMWVEHLPGDLDPAVGYVDAHAKISGAAGRKKLAADLKRKFRRRPGSKPLPKNYVVKWR